MLLRMLINAAGLAVVLALLLFPAAGTLAWPQAWVFIAVYMGSSVAIGVWLMKTDPLLFEGRSKSPVSAGQTPGDRAIILAILAVFAGWFVFMALDARRFGWSRVPFWAQAQGAAIIIGAFIGWVTVLRANSFATTTIALQADQNQVVISTGPRANPRAVACR